MQDIVALTGHVNEAASTKYSVSTEGKHEFKCHVTSKPIIPCCNHVCVHNLMHCHNTMHSTRVCMGFKLQPAYALACCFALQ